MSINYNEYLNNHQKNVKKGFSFFKKYLPEKIYEDNTHFVDYWCWREALNLYKEVSYGIIKSNYKFEKEFNEIIDYYNHNHKIDECNSYENRLVVETNEKLKSLYNRYRESKEIQKLLEQLLSKKYIQKGTKT